MSFHKEQTLILHPCGSNQSIQLVFSLYFHFNLHITITQPLWAIIAIPLRYGENLNQTLKNIQISIKPLSSNYLSKFNSSPFINLITANQSLLILEHLVH